MSTFEELVASRKDWIEQMLIPWCRTATRKDLLKAEREWGDIAGKVTPEATLWTWAWGRFPGLVTEGLPGLDETWRVIVTTVDGQESTGFPEARRSTRGELVLIDDDGQASRPISIDRIQAVRRD